MLKQNGENDRIKNKNKKLEGVGIQHAKTKWPKRQKKKEEEFYLFLNGRVGIQHAKTKWPKRQTRKTGRRECTTC